MPMDQQHSVCSQITVPKHVKHVYNGTGEGVRRAALRKAALVVGSYQVGDIVSYCREPRAGEHELQWSAGSRLTSVKYNHAHAGQSVIPYPSVLLLIVSVHAFHCTQTKSTSPLATNVQTQQGFVDERASLNPTVTGPTQNVDENEDDDDERRR